jgi:predicted phosphodiesterase
LATAYKLGQDLIPMTPTAPRFAEVDVTYHNIKVKKKPFEIPFISDTHYASQECIEDFLDSAFGRIKRTRGCGFFHLGDAWEANDQNSPADAIHNQKYTNESAKDKTTEDIKPIRKKCWIMHDGNHDGDRSRKLVGTSHTRDIARELDVPYSRISSYNIIDFNGHRLIIYTNHGKGRTTPKMVGTRRKTMEESMIYRQADIIAVGHIHRLLYQNIVPNENITENVVIDYENMCMDTQPAKFKKRLITGHFMKYLGGYGQKAGYAPHPAGYPILKLYPDGSYDVEKVWERDWRANLES